MLIASTRITGRNAAVRPTLCYTREPRVPASSICVFGLEHSSKVNECSLRYLTDHYYHRSLIVETGIRRPQRDPMKERPHPKYTFVSLKCIIHKLSIPVGHILHCIHATVCKKDVALPPSRPSTGSKEHP